MQHARLCRLLQYCADGETLGGDMLASEKHRCSLKHLETELNTRAYTQTHTHTRSSESCMTNEDQVSVFKQQHCAAEAVETRPAS